MATDKTTDDDQPTTKGDLRELELRIDTKLEFVQNNLQTEMSAMKDEIIRAFQMAEESIRKDSAHADEVVDNKNRISRIENHLGLSNG